MSNEKSLLKDKNFYVINLLAIIGMWTNILSPASTLMADAFNVTAAQIGLLSTAYSLPVLFVSPIVGVLSDRFGRKKVLVSSIVLFGAGGIMTAWATSYQMLLVFNFIRGLGSPGMLIINNAFVGDFYTDKKRRTNVMGWKTSWTNIGNVILPLLGGFLIGWGWRAPYFSFAFVIICIIPVIFMDEPQIKGNKSADLRQYFSEIWTGMCNVEFLSISVLSIFIYMLLGGFFNAYVPFLVRNILNPGKIGMVMSIMGVSSWIFSMLYGTCTKFCSEENLCKISFLTFTIAFFIGMNANAASTIYLFSAMFGVGIGFVMPAYMSLLMTITTNENRGALVAANNMIKRFGQIIGPVIAGIIFTKWELKGVFTAGAIISAVVLVYSLVVLRGKKEKGEK